MTDTALHHPRKAAQRERFFRFRATVGSMKTGQFVADESLADLLAAYQPGNPGEASGFRVDADSQDEILILGWHPTIKPQQRIMLTWPDGETKREFKIDARKPGDSGPTTTLLFVSLPK